RARRSRSPPSIRIAVASAGCKQARGTAALLLGQLHGFDEDQGLVFTNSEMDNQRTNDRNADLHAQSRQSIEWFAERTGAGAQLLDSFAKGKQEGGASTFPGGLTLEPTNCFSHPGRNLQPKARISIRGRRHDYFFFFFLLPVSS